MPATFTEAGILAALRARHADWGNGRAGRYAFLTHVRATSGHYAQEIDALVLALWPSEHHALHAFEVKCSRSDWLREIRPDTRKSEAARRLADTFTVVAPRAIIRDGELPEGWGLLDVIETDSGLKLRKVVKARPTFPGAGRELDRGLVVAMLRAAGAAALPEYDVGTA